MRLTDANLVFVLHALIIIGVIYSVLVSTCFKLFFLVSDCHIHEIIAFTELVTLSLSPFKSHRYFLFQTHNGFSFKKQKTKHRDYHALPDIKIRETLCRTDICTLISAAFCGKTLNFSKIYKV